jgi:virginiamycin A acetyltransferase
MSGYHPILVSALNASPYDVYLNVASDSVIEEGVSLGGNIELGNRVVVRNGCVLNGNVKIRNGTTLTREIDLIGNIEIGKYSTIARHSSLQANNHSIDTPSLQNRIYTEIMGVDSPRIESEVLVGNDVWIGTRVVVLPGVEIGDGAVIGAGSIVTDNVEPYSVYAGMPSERIKWRFDEEIRELLLEIEWWDWSEEKIRSNQEFFDTNINKRDSIKTFLKGYIDD